MDAVVADMDRRRKTEVAEMDRRRKAEVADIVQRHQVETQALLQKHRDEIDQVVGDAEMMHRLVSDAVTRFREQGRYDSSSPHHFLAYVLRRCDRHLDRAVRLQVASEHHGQEGVGGIGVSAASKLPALPWGVVERRRESSGDSAHLVQCGDVRETGRFREMLERVPSMRRFVNDIEHVFSK